VVMAWVALSDAPVESGAMMFMPGSHRWPQIEHRDTFHEHNLLTRGQEIAVEVDEKQAVLVPLKAGEFSLHHVRLAHASKPNTTSDWRIGLAIRYIPTHVRQVKVRDCATLVRGRDDYGHFEPEPRPEADMPTAAAIAAHDDATQRNLAALYEGTDAKAFRK
jgi:non-haem Fe2+, alpha-ketoglutarate-dependent halogenase